jgi:hypothetical protein
MRTFTRILNNEKGTNASIDQYLEEPVPYSPPPSKISSSSGTHSTQIKCNALKAKTIYSVKRMKYIDSYLSVEQKASLCFSNIC